jgi:hypothetical protein
MPTFKATRRIFTADSNVPHSPKTIFPLLCPVREYEWIEQWQADLVYAESGVAELDCVFTTAFPDEGHDVWVVCRFEPNERIEFVRCNELRVIRYTVALTPTPEGTRITWTQTVTGLSDAGNRFVENLSGKEYKDQIGVVGGKMLSYFLETGERMSMAMQEAHNR